MTRLLRDSAIAVGGFAGLICFGLVLTLTISSAVGYLPYSDRPGPGWIGPSFSFGQIAFYLSWSVLLLIPTIVYGCVLFGYLRTLRLLGAPLFGIRIIGAVSAGLVAFVLAAGTGWYISMAAFPAFVGGILGVGWGALLAPRYFGPGHPERPGSMRWGASGIVVLAVTGGLYWTFFSPHYSQDLSLSVVRVRATGDKGVSPTLKPRETALLDSLFPNRSIEQGLLGSSSSGGPTQARMLIVVTAPLTGEAQLREPKGVSLVYIQRGDRWEMFPANAPTLSARVKIGPGSTANAVTFAWNASDPDTIHWEPH